MKIIKIFFIISVVFISSCTNQEKEIDAEVSIAKIMNSSKTGFKQASEVITFKFPEDYAAHNEYKIEWWYFTGNVQTEDGHKFGYQFTIFRNGLSFDTTRNSSFSSNNLYLAHFAISDITNNKFYFTEKTVREAVDLAGTTVSPFRVFIENWEIKAKFNNYNYLMPEFSIVAKDSNFAIDLTLTPQKKMVLHGNQGLSDKSYEKGNSSYYYSFTNLKTEGNISIGDESFQIEGKSWFDREFSTSALSVNQRGWNWFSLQLEDSTEIMCFELRDNQNKQDFAKGTYISSDGKTEFIKATDFTITPVSYFTSNTGTKYPSKWKFEYKTQNIFLEIETQIPNQELNVFTKYYEGSVKFKGTKNNRKIAGSGYVELTGY